MILVPFSDYSSYSDFFGSDEGSELLWIGCFVLQKRPITSMVCFGFGF